MAENVEVRITAINETAPGMAAARGTVERELNKTTAAVKRHSDQSNAYMRKINEQARELAFRFVGVTAAVGGVRLLGQAVRDAGYDSTKWNEAMGKVSATIGAQLLPEVQALSDIVVKYQDEIAQFAAKTISAIKAPFEALASTIAAEVSIVSIALGKLTGNKGMQAYGKALAEEAATGYKKAWEELTLDPSKIKVQKPVAPQKSKNASAGGKQQDFDSYMRSIGFPSKEEIAYASEEANKGLENQTQQRQAYLEQTAEIERIYREQAIAAIPEQDQRELALLVLKYEEREQIAIKAGADLKLLHEAQGMEQEQLEKQQAARRVEIAKNEAIQKAQSAVNYAQEIGQTLEMIAQASRANAEEMKAVRMMGAIIDSASAGVAAARSIWSSSTSWQEALAATIAVEALLTAQLGAQIAQINNAKYALGGDFVTSGPQTIVVGDNPGGRERVQVTPLSSANINGPSSGGSVVINITDQSGGLTESFRTRIRSGEADTMIADLLSRANRIGVN